MRVSFKWEVDVEAPTHTQQSIRNMFLKYSYVERSVSSGLLAQNLQRQHHIFPEMLPWRICVTTTSAVSRMKGIYIGSKVENYWIFVESL